MCVFSHYSKTETIFCMDPDAFTPVDGAIVLILGGFQCLSTAAHTDVLLPNNPCSINK